MSRVGKKPVTLPKGVECRVQDRRVAVKGPKGELQLDLHPAVAVAVQGAEVSITRTSDEKAARAVHGTTRALLQNMALGVAQGYVRKLEIVGVGYRAQVQGSKLVLNVGFCHQVEVIAPAGVTFKCPDQTHIEVSGIDKQKVGEMAAQVRGVRPPEPYKGKGIRYDGEHVRRKAGKAAK